MSFYLDNYYNFFFIISFLGIRNPIQKKCSELRGLGALLQEIRLH